MLPARLQRRRRTVPAAADVCLPGEFKTRQRRHQSPIPPYRFTRSAMGPARSFPGPMAVRLRVVRRCLRSAKATGAQPPLPPAAADSPRPRRRWISGARCVTTASTSPIEGAFLRGVPDCQRLLAHTRPVQGRASPAADAYTARSPRSVSRPRSANYCRRRTSIRRWRRSNYADKIRTRSSSIHGVETTTTPSYLPVQSERMFAAVKGLGGNRTAGDAANNRTPTARANRFMTNAGRDEALAGADHRPWRAVVKKSAEGFPGLPHRRTTRCPLAQCITGPYLG